MSPSSSVFWVMSTQVAEMKALERAFRRERPQRFIQTLSIQKEMLNVLRRADASYLPHLVVLDFELDGLNGIEILREREQHDYWLQIPFVVLTSQFDQRIHDLCRQSGADNTITKPAFLGDYLALIRELSDANLSMSDGPASMS